MVRTGLVQCPRQNVPPAHLTQAVPVRNSLVWSDGPSDARTLEKSFLREEDLDNCREEGQEGSRAQFQSKAKTKHTKIPKYEKLNIKIQVPNMKPAPGPG